MSVNLARQSVHLPFGMACLFELALLVVTAIGCAILRRPVFADFHWNEHALLGGVVGSLPLLVFFWWFWQTRQRSLARLRGFLDHVARPWMQPWSLGAIGLVSLLAGFGEEVMFRGLIQGGLADVVSPGVALAVASACFGLCHFVNGTYALLATVAGAYLGASWLVSENLLVPILIHAIYDGVALLYFLRVRAAPDLGSADGL
jgi:hypothetical protein